MTWTQPQNLDDNTIVTADYWNSILGNEGSLFTINKQILTRANCNIHTARILGNPYGSTSTSASTKTKRLGLESVTGSIFIRDLYQNNTNAFFIPETNKSKNYYPFTNTQSSGPNVFTGVPFIVLWQFRLGGTYEGPKNPFRVRTTLEREYVTNAGELSSTVETIAAQYYYVTPFDNSPWGLGTEYLCASVSYVSHSYFERYYFTVNHSSSVNLAAEGQVTVIINPGMV